MSTATGTSRTRFLYAAVPSLVFYAMFGSSRHLVVSSMSATAALSVGIVGAIAKGGKLLEAQRGLPEVIMAFQGGRRTSLRELATPDGKPSPAFLRIAC